MYLENYPHLQGVKKGDIVYYINRKKHIITCIWQKINDAGKAYLRREDDNKDVRVNPESVFRSLEDCGFASTPSTSLSVHQSATQAAQAPEQKPRFTLTVDERFETLEDLVETVANDSPQSRMNSLLILGEGGLGKSFTVKKKLASMGLVEGEDMKTIKGVASAKFIYETLFNYQESLIIFDDCDAALMDKDSKLLMKAALDSYDERVVTWGNSDSSKSDYPNEFEFRGRIIFISNKSKYSIDQAILTRCAKVDLSMTREEKVQRMRTIVNSPDYMPHVPQEDKEAVLSVIKEWGTNAISLRTLVEVMEYKQSGNENWQRMAKYSMNF